jgi:hypothetical protein
MSMLMQHSGRLWYRAVLHQNKVHGLTPLGLSRLMGLQSSATGTSLGQLEETALSQREELDRQEQRSLNWSKLFCLTGLFVASYVSSGLTGRISGTMATGRWDTGLVCLLLTLLPENVMDIGHGGLELAVMTWLLQRAVGWYLGLSWTLLGLSWAVLGGVVWLGELSLLLDLGSLLLASCMLLAAKISPYTSLAARLGCGLLTVTLALTIRAVLPFLPLGVENKQHVHTAVNNVELRKYFIIVTYWAFIGVAQLIVFKLFYSNPLATSTS